MGRGADTPRMAFRRDPSPLWGWAWGARRSAWARGADKPTDGVRMPFVAHPGWGVWDVRRSGLGAGAAAHRWRWKSRREVQRVGLTHHGRRSDAIHRPIGLVLGREAQRAGRGGRRPPMAFRRDPCQPWLGRGARGAAGWVRGDDTPPMAYTRHPSPILAGREVRGAASGLYC